MSGLAGGWSGSMAPWLSERWVRYGTWLLWIAVAYMVVAAVGRLAYAAPYLVFDVEPWAALDLKHRHAEVGRWFAGSAVYGAVENADYPPASYAILWPLLGWLPLQAARWLWAATAAVGLAALAWLMVRESGAEGLREQSFVGLLVFSTYPAQMNLFVGQVGIHALAALLVALVWLRREDGGAWRDVAASLLLLAALVKPTLTLPFFWLVCLVPTRRRPWVLVGLGYLGLTVLAGAFQEEGLPALLRDWLAQTSAQTTPLEGYANVHKWLAAGGLGEWALPASLLLLAASGAWIYRHRRADAWILLGVAALTARFWAHHRPYDDLLLLLPMVALFRLAGRGAREADGRRRAAAGLLLALTWGAMHTPTWAFYDLSGSYRLLIEVGQTALWVAVLAFLAACVGVNRGAADARSAPAASTGAARA